METIRIEISAAEAALTEAEIREIVGPGKIAELKAKEKAPILKAYRLFHEGVSNPSRLTSGLSRPIAWARDAVAKAHEKVKAGLKLFEDRGHTDPSQREGRKVLGEVVAAALRNINGVLSSVIIGHIAPEARDIRAVSMEGEWIVEPGAEMDQALDISEITGIVLTQKAPAFPGSTELLAIAAEEQKMADDRRVSIDPTNFHEVLKFFKNVSRDLTIKPTQLWPLEEILTGDAEIRAYVEKSFVPASELERLKGEHENLSKTYKEASGRLTAIDAREKISEIGKDMPEFIRKRAADSIQTLHLEEGQKIEDAVRVVLDRAKTETDALVAAGAKIPGVNFDESTGPRLPAGGSGKTDSRADWMPDFGGGAK
jgi:hypothetical protein